MLNNSIDLLKVKTRFTSLMTEENIEKWTNSCHQEQEKIILSEQNELLKSF